MNLRLYFLSLFIILSSLAGRSQISAEFNDDELLMGRLATLRVYVDLPSDTAKVEFPLLDNALREKRKYVGLLNDTIEIRTKYKKALETTDGISRMRYDLFVQSFDSGRYELPSLEFLVDGETLASPEVTLNVLPVKVNVDDKIDDFTDVAEPFELNPDPDEVNAEEGVAVVVWWIVAGLILLLIAIAIFMFMRRGKLFKTGEPLTPYEEAIDRLHKLKKQNLPAKGKTKEYYTKLTGVLRSYLNRQFQIRTYEKTSAEILLQVDNDEKLSQFVSLLRPILETSDFVKFAKVNPGEEENSKNMSDAERFVELTRPRAEVEEKEGGAGK